MNMKQIIVGSVLFSVVSMADTSGFDKILKLQGISFHVQATNEGSLNQLNDYSFRFKWKECCH